MPSITTTPAHPAFGPGARGVDIKVLDSHLHYVESGAGAPIAFLHGNPTSSFLWRHILRRLEGRGRLLALDLIGFGDSGRPAIDYTLDQHQSYVDAWFDALDLRNVTLVAQDYGAAFAIDWASRHPDRVKALVILEPVLRPIESALLPESFIAVRKLVRTPGAGEQFVQQDNKFITEVFPTWFLKPLPAEDLRHYQSAFPTPESRRAILFGPRNLPVDSDPKSTVDFLDKGVPWLSSSQTPKLLLTFKPGFLVTPSVEEWSRKTIRNLEIEASGEGFHLVQEEEPERISSAIIAWQDRHG